MNHDQKILISIDTAALMLNTSKRTLWRWLNAGRLTRQGTDRRGRVMLAYAELAPKFCIPLAGGGGMTSTCW